MTSAEPGAGGIGRNLAAVRGRIEQAAGRAGRDPASVRLVVVTKGRPIEQIRAAYDAGARDLGENRVEEGRPKIASLGELGSAVWHMVGHVQSRKAKEVVPGFAWVHSVDRLKVARLLAQAAVDSGARLRVLLECNVSGEAAKAGWPLAEESTWQAVLPEFADLARLPGLEVCGLMTMAPWSAQVERVRPVFSALRRLLGFVNENLGLGWRELSMGMSDDFEVALEEGATMVRIGRAVFEGMPAGL